MLLIIEVMGKLLSIFVIMAFANTRFSQAYGSTNSESTPHRDVVASVIDPCVQPISASRTGLEDLTKEITENRNLLLQIAGGCSSAGGCGGG
jgi:hypothetical protein